MYFAKGDMAFEVMTPNFKKRTDKIYYSLDAREKKILQLLKKAERMRAYPMFSYNIEGTWWMQPMLAEHQDKSYIPCTGSGLQGGGIYGIEANKENIDQYRHAFYPPKISKQVVETDGKEVEVDCLLLASPEEIVQKQDEDT